MKEFLKKWSDVGTAGVLFQAVVNFQGVTDNTNLAGNLSGFFSGNNSNLAQFFNAAFTMALSAGAILAVLRLSWAGWLYMSSDAFGTKSKAREVIQNAILGLLLLIGIWVILNQINPCLLNLNILQTINGSSSSTCSTS